MENQKITIDAKELQAILNTLAQIPTQYGAGLFALFTKKAQDLVAKPETESLKADEEHG